MTSDSWEPSDSWDGSERSDGSQTGEPGSGPLESGGPGATAELLRLDAYLDAAPRTGADAVGVGPFTMFLHRGPWGYYARPGSQRDRGHRFTSAEVEAVLAAQREREENESIEWIHDVDPSLAEACVGAGLAVVMRPLLTIDASAFVGGVHEADGINVMVLDAEHPQLPMHRSVAHVSFSNGGTAIGAAGVAERNATAVDAAAVDWAIKRSRLGHTIAIAAFDPVDGMVGVGSAQPVVEPSLDIRAAELTGIAVLPTHRRRGVAAAITSALIVACAARGIDCVLLSAQDDDVARVYERVGFHPSWNVRRSGTAHSVRVYQPA